MGFLYSKALPKRCIPRGGWGARAPLATSPFTYPIPCVYLTTVASTNSLRVSYQQDIVRFLRELQKIDMYDEGLPDIAYNFYIGADGRVYEGRGWTAKPSLTAEENPENIQTLAVAYIQEWPDTPPSAQMIEVTKYIISNGLQERYIYDQYVMAGIPVGTDLQNHSE